MKPVPTACRLAIAGVLLVGWSLPALADTSPTEAPKTGAFGSGWANAEAATGPADSAPAPLPYGTGYEQRHAQRATTTTTTSTITWPPATNAGRNAAGGGRSGQSGGNGGGGGGGRGR